MDQHQLRKPYNKFRQVFLQTNPNQYRQPSNQKRNAEIKNHQYNTTPISKPKPLPYTSQQNYQSMIIDQSIIAPFSSQLREKMEVNPETILIQQKAQLEVYRQKLLNTSSSNKKKKSRRGSVIGVKAEMELKNIMQKVGALTKKVEFMNMNSQSLKLKQSSTFAPDFVSNSNRKKNKYNPNNYYQQIETDRPKMITQYQKLRQICRPDFLKTHRESTLHTNGSQKNMMMKSMLNRQKSEESIFNRADINKILNKQRHRKHSNLQAPSGYESMRQSNSNLLRNLRYKDVDNSASGDD